MHGWFLIAKGDFDKAIEKMQQALVLDPLSLPLIGNLADALRFAGRFSDAIEQYDKAIEMDSLLNAINSFRVLHLTMFGNFKIKRTTATDKDFQSLVSRLDHELWHELKEDQARYDQCNKVPDIKTAVVIYADGEPVACGCFKEFDTGIIEIKRMFVQKEHRGKGLSKKILYELEQWAIEKGYAQAVLETSIHFNTAINLYKTNGYEIISNYGPYAGLEESVCMQKALRIN